jgi:hypothetical protein
VVGIFEAYNLAVEEWERGERASMGRTNWVTLWKINEFLEQI